MRTELLTVKHELAGRLRERCEEPSARSEQETWRLLALLEDACEQWNGAGMAANQLLRLALRPWQIDRIALIYDAEATLALVDPRLTNLGTANVVEEEGCLSIPGRRFRVTRWRDVSVTTRRLDGEEMTIIAHGQLARVIQHEVDHLNGKLIDEHPEVQ
jgi:peptide deformylase